ncbi:MAG: nicotinate-nucleotide adenylyltransferase [Chloroflexota bacterium]|nr:nicotinate-nucleotide adenylyltransferase [Chloroflexota bacterium]
MASIQRIGALGGTFDPIHIGHLIAAAELQHVLGLDRVLFLPAGDPPHKTEQRIAPAVHRLAMLRLAVADHQAFEASTLDLSGSGPSYTVDLLARLHEAIGPMSLVFLMGEDSLCDLPTWHQPGRIAALAEIGVARRPGVAVDMAALMAAVPEAAERVHLVSIPEIGVSSRDIRRRIAAGAPIAFQVPRAVETYIEREGLYRSLPGVSIAEQDVTGCDSRQ